MTKFDYTTAVLRLEEKCFASTAEQALQGLKLEGVQLLAELGEAGWELVSVIPYSRSLGVEAALAFLKRPRS